MHTVIRYPKVVAPRDIFRIGGLWEISGSIVCISFREDFQLFVFVHPQDFLMFDGSRKKNWETSKSCFVIQNGAEALHDYSMIFLLAHTHTHKL